MSVCGQRADTGACGCDAGIVNVSDALACVRQQLKEERERADRTRSADRKALVEVITKAGIPPVLKVMLLADLARCLP